MWTNVFKIGGLHHISWFQFLPHESDSNALPDKSVKLDQKDVATYMVLSSHLRLQKEGFLSAWTNSFVGPWDPSQGLHNPDEKIKLWLFLPGPSVLESAQAAVPKLKVVASGVWLAPGDSEEVAAALSQALRNRIERELIGFSYMRFGDVFSKYQPFQSEEVLRKGQSTVEFIFAATEEAIFAHVIISAKHVRAVSSSDIERISKHSTNFGCELPVIVYPHGMRGKLTGCSPSDLVKQVYYSSGKFKSTNGFIGLPHNIFQGSGCQLRGQNCFVEVTLGCPKSGSEKALYSSSSNIIYMPRHVGSECTAMGRGSQTGQLANSSCYEKTFIYPAEAVLIPVLQTSFSRSSLKRFWLQNWTGPSLAGSAFAMHCAGSIELMEGSSIESDRASTRDGYDSSSNSNSSSISSISSSSSDGDYKMTMEGGDLEADADSLTCRQSGLRSNDQLQNNVSKMGSKRPRSGITESFSQADTVTNASLEANNSGITGIQDIGSHLDWDDDDRGVAMDIQALLSEFGDFGDFFVDDALPFGEPPGTAELQALMFSAPDCGDVRSSPMGVMDVSDQMLPPVSFPSFDTFNPPPPSGIEESLSKGQEVTINSGSSALTTHTLVPSAGEFDHLVKAEALMTFAPEYGAVEATSGESSSIFRSPYLPKSIKQESPNSSPKSYIYGATPPSSPCFNKSDRETSMSFTSKTCAERQNAGANHHPKQYYTYVESGKEQQDRRLLDCGSRVTTCEGVAASPFTNFSSSNSVKSGQRKIADGTFGSENSLMLMKNSLATEVESIMFQVSMCRMRHTLLSSSGHMPTGLNRLGGSTAIAQLPVDSSTMTDDVSGNYEVKRRESIPVRIAGDSDGTMLDGHLNAPVGVWRSVGVSKVSRPINSPSIEASASLTHNSFSEEGILSYGQRQPLQDFLDGMPLLVQQATCFVDMALDSEFGDGPYSWLALQEQWRQEFSCGPSMIHAGCGGTLASCHSLDVAGVELVDPLSADVQAATVISLLQSDIKAALKSAFGVLDGPLSVTDWCKGHNQSGDSGHVADSFSAESTMTECRDSSNAISVGDPMSPTMSSTGGPSCLKPDGMKMDDSCQRKLNSDLRALESDQLLYSRLRPTLSVLPSPAILVGYQDDWLKTSAGALQLWEKAPLEPYALPKPITYTVICPDIDPLTSAAADFFQQLGTVYETCKLGTHSPQTMGNQMEIDSGKRSSSGFVLLDCPQSMKIESSNASLVGSISDYFLSLSNGWDLASYLKSLSRALKSLKLGPFISTSQKEGNGSPCAVIYVVCPFPEPIAVLQTLIESSVAIGSVVLHSDRERRSFLYSQVGKALMGSAAVDESSASNIPVIPGFSIPKLVLQIVTVDVIFRVTTPALNELVVLKETAFTVYNKARRISRGSSNDVVHSSSLSGRSPLMLTQMASSLQGTWRDCVGARMTGPSLSREGEIEASLRPATWDNTWQAARAGGLICDPSRMGDCLLQDESRYMFEPLFILAEPGSLNHGVSPANFGNIISESYTLVSDDITGGFMHGASSVGSADSGSGSQLDGTGTDGFASSRPRTPSLHCCYGWTEDWRWLVCVWTDSRGELLDSNIFPFGGISSRQDTKGLQSIFVQILQHGCQILQACSSSDTCATKPRDFVITRIGSFYELEYLEWQKALMSVGGSEMKWPLQLRRSMSDGMAASSNGPSLQQQEMGLIQERNLPSSPSPLYSPPSKNSGYIKNALGQTAVRKQLMGGHSSVDSSKGMLQWVQSISFVTTSIDHSLQLVFQADSLSPGGQSGGTGPPNYLEGFTPVKSLGSTSASHMFIPSPSMRFLLPTPLRLPTCLTAESPPLAHLLHSKGSAIPLATGFVVSKAVPSMRKDRRNVKDEWPAVLSVSLLDYYGGNNISREKNVRGVMKQGGRGLGSETKDLETETHLVLESVAAELHALSWMTVSPAYLDRRTALPFHCDMVLRLRRLLHFADKEITRHPEK